MPPEVLRGYDSEINRQLEQIAQRINDPGLRKQFRGMMTCGIKDSTGRCRGWGDYVMGALIRNGITDRYDLEGAIQYVFEKMLMPTSDQGEARATLFSDFESNRPDSPEHFQARFLTWVKYAVGAVRRGKIHRLSSVEQRPQGTVSIGQGRWKPGQATGDISPDAIPNRPSTDADLAEMISDILTLLRQKEMAYPLPLTRLFQAIMSGQNTAQQRALIGDTNARIGRQIIIQTVEDYARSTQNYRLLQVLQRLKDFQPGTGQEKPAPQARPTMRTQERITDPSPP